MFQLLLLAMHEADLAALLELGSYLLQVLNHKMEKLVLAVTFPVLEEPSRGAEVCLNTTSFKR